MGVVRTVARWVRRFTEHPYTKLAAFVLVLIVAFAGFKSLEDNQAQVKRSRIESCQSGNRDRAVLRGLLHAAFDQSPAAQDDLATLDRCYGDIDCERRIQGTEPKRVDPVCEDLLRQYASGGPGGGSALGASITVAAANVLQGGPQ